mmetsp:Transcript_80124/g.226797  ORF Transcript_80124/g.226797 Transcript_80124/m.226797 type:complete len:570 (+) Transcript_80124:59-1768(+)
MSGAGREPVGEDAMRQAGIVEGALQAFFASAGAQGEELQESASGRPRFHIPGLASRAWWGEGHLSELGWAQRLRASAGAIVAEFAALKTMDSVDSNDWQRFPLIEEGYWQNDNCSRCPVTAELLASIGPALCDCALGHAYFSLLMPGARVPPHCGVSNAKLRGQLLLQTPEQVLIHALDGDGPGPTANTCGLRVASERRFYEGQGQLLFFDDSLEHEAWNLAASPRAVLIFDFWHPHLLPHSRALIRAAFPLPPGPVSKEKARGRSPGPKAVVPLSGALSQHLGAFSTSAALSLPLADVVQLGRTSCWWASLVRGKQLWKQLVLRDFGDSSHADDDDPRAAYMATGPVGLRLERLPTVGDCNILLKFVMAGDHAVGKTSFMRRFIHDVFESPHPHPTIGVDFQITGLLHEGRSCKLQFWDVAGPERFRTVQRAFYRGASGFLLMYDETCRASFENAQGHWYADIRSCRPAAPAAELPIVLCACKADLRERAEVSPAEGAAAARELGTLFARTSGKTGLGINFAVGLLMRHCPPMVRSPAPRVPPNSPEDTLGRRAARAACSLARGCRMQ